MKKVYKRLIIFTIAFAAIIGILYYDEYHNYFEDGENGSFDIAVGETFTFKLRDRGSSTATVWLNPKPGLALEYSTFIPDFLEQGCDGCAGTGIYRFKALKPGSYTMKMAPCPPHQDCTEENTQPSNVFSVTVTK